VQRSTATLPMDGRPPASNRRKRCSQPSGATSMGVRPRTSNRADRAHLPRPSIAYRRSTRIEPHRRTRSDGARQLIFLCSALAALIARPIPHRSSQFSRPAFFCRSFFWALLQANPASGSFAASAFRFRPYTIGFPPIKQPLALEAEATRFWVPQENGARKRRKFSYVLPQLYNSRRVRWF
jgi:hypothetical protein